MTLSPSSSCLYYYVLSIALLLLANVAAQQYNCRTGCSLDANNMGPPVCGEDYLTYLNECLAVCQVHTCMNHRIESSFLKLLHSHSHPRIIFLERSCPSFRSLRKLHR